MIKYIEKSIGRKESGQYMNRYDYIIFDIDDTLFQYKKAERHIMSRIFEEENQSIDEDVYEALWALSLIHI